MQQPAWENEAERIISTQEMMQHVSPAFLSTFSYKNEWYVAKQIQPTSDKICIQKTAKQDDLVANYVKDLGVITASAQLRSSGRYKSSTADQLKNFAENASWVKIVTDWSIQYAKQVQEDYLLFLKAWKSGYFTN